MDVVSRCPECGNRLEIPREFQNVICADCGSAYLVNRSGGALSLTPVEPRTMSPDAGAEEFLAKYDEEIGEVRTELEAVRSREQGVPLGTGCALFGLFGVAIVVLAFFVTIGRSYFGGWIFYLALAAVLILAIRRVRARLMTPSQLRALRERRAELET